MLAATLSVATLGWQNVNGGTLARCSGTGMALTGYTRNGHCVDQNDDAGSHHICIDMQSSSGGNFCQVTGQPNWCDRSMPCDSAAGVCPVQHWCVCQWAFASYISRAGGCDKIKNIVCEATNMEAYRAYQSQAASQPHIASALQCLEERCGLNTNATSSADGEQAASALTELSPTTVLGGGATSAMLLGAAFFAWRRGRAKEPNSLLKPSAQRVEEPVEMTAA